MRKESRAGFTVVVEEHSYFSFFPSTTPVAHSFILSFFPLFSLSLFIYIHIYFSFLSFALLVSVIISSLLRLRYEKICRRSLAVKSLSLDAFQTAKREEKLAASERDGSESW